jgi:hypothetical protein
MKPDLIYLWIVLVFFSTTAMATDYIYRDLMANTLPSVRCEIESSAILTAALPENIARYSKIFCQSQGYGWHVEKIKEGGKAICKTCTGSEQNKSKCHMEDVVVSCKRIKPGSVGLLPGKS